MPDKKILNAVESAKDDFRQVQKKFDKETNAIQEKARRAPVYIALTPADEAYNLQQQLNYNIKIVEEFASVTTDYWAACEALILSLDEICRPLLKENPSAISVGTVARFISEIIKDVSKVEIDFSVFLNSSNLGDVGSINPKASVIAQTIERFWKEAYKDNAGYAQDIKRIKDKEDAEQKRIEENKKKAEEGLKAAIAREKNLICGAVSAKETREIIVSEGDKRIADFEKELFAVASRLKERTVNDEKERLQSELQTASLELKTIGFFANKKAIKAKISSCKRYIKKTAASPEIARRLKEIDEIAAGELAKYKSAVNNHVSERFRLEEVRRDFGTPSAALAGDYMLMINILNFIASSGAPQELETIAESCEISSTQKTSALVRQLHSQNFLWREEHGGKAFYVISPDINVTEVEVWEENGKLAKKGLPCPPDDIEGLFE